MPTYTQAHRPIAIRTPLGEDVLLLTGFQGREAISQLFNFQVDLLAEPKSEIHFDRIIGQLHSARNAHKRFSCSRARCWVV
jgi:type VI secretion system secreted protein VgrG